MKESHNAAFILSPASNCKRIKIFRVPGIVGRLRRGLRVRTGGLRDGSDLGGLGGLDLVAHEVVLGLVDEVGAVGDLLQPPVPVVLQGIDDLLGVGVHQVRPGLPQGMHDVVNEADLSIDNGFRCG